MMYHNKLVATIRSRGKQLRELGDSVQIPFGSEYSIQLKNLDPTRRAVVEIEIDGKDTLDDGRLVINAGETVDVERFIVDGALDKGPRFKFVEMTDGIAASRGVKGEDGLVNITFQFEEPIRYGGFYIHDWNTPFKTSPTVYGDPICKSPSSLYSSVVDGSMRIGGSVGASLGSSAGLDNSFKSAPEVETLCCSNILNQNEEGITVMGSESKQKFESTTVRDHDLGETHQIIFKLIGGEVKKPRYVRTKITCGDCTTKNKSSNQFCGNCGSNLKYA